MRAADAAGEPLLLLGGGSNLVLPDAGFDGTAVLIRNRGVERVGDALVVAAGEPWDDLVARSVAEQLAGMDVDDPDYNDLVNKLNQAAADCSA